MLSVHFLWPFLVATVIFSAIPGPAILYSAAQTLTHGKRSGLLTTLGLHIGGYGHVVATTMGLSALLHYIPLLYLTIKLIGAAYLVVLGIGMLRSKPDTPIHSRTNFKPNKNFFRDGVAVELLNPKTAIFFVAFLPQFVDPTATLPVAVQLLILGVFVNISFSCGDIVTVLLASSLHRRAVNRGWTKRAARVVAGSILIGLGARMAIARA